MSYSSRTIASAILCASLLGSLPASAQSVSDLAALSRAVYSLDAKDPKRARAPVSLGGAERTFSLPKGYKLLHGVMRSQGAIQAMAVEHLATGKVIVAFRGTRATDITDLFADLGIAARNVGAIIAASLRTLGKMLKETVKALGRGIKKVGRGVKKAASKVWSFFTGKKKKKEKKRQSRSVRDALKDAKPEVFNESKGKSKFWSFLKKFWNKLTKHLPLQKKVRAAKAFVETVLQKTKSGGQRIAKSDLVITGHSLGGYLAQVAGAHYKVRTETFNAPGARHASYPSLPIVNHVRRSDVVGRLGRHIGKVLLYRDAQYKLTDLKQRYLVDNHDMGSFIPAVKAAWKKK